MGSDEWKKIQPERSPPFRITKLCDGAPTDIPRMGGQQPLKHLKVVDFTNVVAGPFCGRLLAWQGADVISVRDPHGINNELADTYACIGKMSICQNTLQIQEQLMHGTMQQSSLQHYNVLR